MSGAGRGLNLDNNSRSLARDCLPTNQSTKKKKKKEDT